MQRLRIATRESPLALAQTEMVKNALLKKYPELSIDIVGMTTEGDRKLDVSLAKMGGKGLFIKELEHALLDHRADCAVHSMKDVPMRLADNLSIAAMLPRNDPRDVFVSNRYRSLQHLPDGAIVGTSSLRRQCLIKVQRPDLRIKLLRGNLQTRLNKLDNHEYDALILAAAGLNRLNLLDRINQYFSTDEFIPAVGQGAIGIECDLDNDAYSFLTTLNDPITFARVTAERMVSKKLNAGCHVPLGAFAEYREHTLLLRAMLGNPINNQLLHAQAEGPIDEAEQIGLHVAKQLIDQGAATILANL